MGLAIALFVSFGLVAVLFNSQLRNFHKTNELPVGFALTLIATFLGVYLSIYASDMQRQSQDSEEASNLLDRLTADAHSKLNLTNRLTGTWDEASTKLFYPSTLKAMTMDESFVRRFSPQFVVTAGSDASFLEALVDELRRQEPKGESEQKENTDLYKNMLKKLIIMMATEKHYLRGEITPETLEILYRCSLDSVRAPLGDRSRQNSGCDNDLSRIQMSLPKRLFALEEQLNILYPD